MSGARIPGELSSIYNKLMSTEEGRAVMKRIRVTCGICKSTKYYSIHRGITRVASVIACESCRHFYQKMKRSPTSMDCSQPSKGSCYRDGTFDDTKCKACLAMQVIDCCPHLPSMYKELSSQLSEECQKGIRGRPIDPSELGPNSRGSLGFEIWKENAFVEVAEGKEFPYNFKDADSNTDTEELSDNDARDTEVEGTNQPEKKEEPIAEQQQTDDKSMGEPADNKKDLPNPKASKENLSFIPPEEKDQMEDDEEDEEEVEEESSSTPPDIEEELEQPQLPDKEEETIAGSFKISDIVSGDLEFDAEEEALVDDPLPPPKPPKEKVSRSLRAAAQNASSVKSSERIRQKARKVDYINKPAQGKKSKGPIYDSSGCLVKSGKDLCDCLQGECPGCHFPCPKCRSPKCGSECRVNRRWYFERIEVEGTKVCWTNKFLK